MESKINLKKNKTIILILLFILPVFAGLFTFIPVRADVGQYELRTDPFDPFTFVVDTVCITSDGYISLSGDNYFYHQVNLEKDNHYIFYLVGGYISMDDTNIHFHSAISTSVDEYFIAMTEPRGRLILYLNPTTTGLYNLTIWCNAEYGSVGFSGIGFLKVPIMPLDTEMTSSHWDFIKDPIFAVIIDLESGKEYQTGYDGSHFDYSGLGAMYYCHINQLYSTYYLVGDELDGSHNLLSYSGTDIITTSGLGQGSGKYLFYSLTSYSFSLMEVVEETTTPSLIPGYSLLILGFASISTIFLLIKKFKSK